MLEPAAYPIVHCLSGFGTPHPIGFSNRKSAQTRAELMQGLPEFELVSKELADTFGEE